MKKLSTKFLSLFLAALMACSLLSVGASAMKDEMQKVKFYVLYVDDSFNLGYNYKDGWDVEYECQYNSCSANGYNHSLACSVIKDEIDNATVDDGYKIVGWTKTASANPTIYTTYSGTTAAGKYPYTIYLVAKSTAPKTQDITLTYNANGGTGAPAADTKTVNQGASATFTVSSTVPTNGSQTFLGWSTSASDTAGTYQGGDTLTTRTSMTLYAIWGEHTHVDGNGDGLCDICQACMHEKDGEGYCTVAGCTHGDSCCPKHPAPPADPTEPTEDELVDLLGDSFVTVSCTVNDDHASKSYALIPGSYTTSISGTTLTVEVFAASYIDAYNAVYAGHTLFGTPFASVSLTWDAAEEKWVNPTPSAIAFSTRCSATEPEIPQLDKEDLVSLLEGAVEVTCTTEDSGHSSATYGLLGTKGEDYTVEQNGATATVTIEAAPYVDAFSADNGRHTLIGAAGTDTAAFTLTWDKENGWTLVSDKVVFRTICSTAGDDDEKTDKPGMDKKADGSDTIGTVTPGQTITFTLNSTIGTDMKGSSAYTLEFHDTLSGPITFSNDVTVTIKGQAITNEYYTLLARGNTFILTVDCTKALEDGLFTAADMGSAPVVVTYTATVDSDAQDGAEVKNEAWVNDSIHDIVDGTVDGDKPQPPHTGGMGTAAFTALGAALVCGAAALYVVNRRKYGENA